MSTRADEYEIGWWRIFRHGFMFGRHLEYGIQADWYAQWDHGDDEPVVRGPFATATAAEEAIR